MNKLSPSYWSGKLNELSNERRRISLARKQYAGLIGRVNPDVFSLDAFDYYRCIFVHIPKAAGISVALTLFGNYGGSHRTLRWYQNNYMRHTFSRYFKFTFVRNPYDRLYSAYTFLRKGGINDEDRAFSERVLVKYETFEDFVLGYLNEETIYSYIHFYPQLEFLIDRNHKIAVDFIGRFENIDQDFFRVSQKIGVNKTLPHLNKTESKKEQPVFSDQVKAKIQELYKDDFMKLGYEM